MAVSPAMTSEARDVIASLQSRWGQRVVTDAAELDYYATDVHSRGQSLLAVLRPGDARELAGAVEALIRAGVAVVPRGGGMSYTGGYLATRQPSVVVDTGALDKVVEINVEDAYVVVEAGVTWERLRTALEARKVRTPYFGPMSGSHATVGGALSQGSAFHGSGRHGCSAEAVLGLEVVTAQGEVLRTGSAAAPGTAPFFRWHGPDLTGVFLGDCGLLGIKTRATLRLVPMPSHIDYLSWQFERADGVLAAMGALARAGLPSEVAAFDPALSRIRMRRASLAADAKSLGQVVRKAGWVQGLKLAARGRDFLDPELFALHVTLEGDSAGEIEARVRAARNAVAPYGHEVENSVPRVMAANPFAAANAMLGPSGERWAPVHGIVPHSAAAPLFEALQALFAGERADMDRHGLSIGTLMTTVGAQATLIEPCIYWPDSHNAFHQRTVEARHRARIGCPGENPEARARADGLRQRIAGVMRAHGAVNFQIGKFYGYREGRDPAALALLDAIKARLDPKGLMNPGVLAR